MLESSEKGTEVQMSFTSSESRGENNFLYFLVILFLVQPRRLLTFLSARTQRVTFCKGDLRWLLVSSLPTKTLRSFSLELLLVRQPWAHAGASGLFLPWCRNLQFLFMYLMMLLLANFTNLLNPSEVQHNHLVYQVLFLS